MNVRQGGLLGFQWLACALACLTPACADDTSEVRVTVAGGAVPAAGLAVLGSDYQSSALSLVDLGSRQPVVSALTHSGSAVSVGGTALSGDMVLAQNPPVGQVVLVDRASSVLTFVDPQTRKVSHQVSVATGFYANAQDFAAVSPVRGYVSRFSRNPNPSPSPDDHDDGDDLLVMDLATRKPVGRIALGPHVTKPSANPAQQNAMLARGGQMALVGPELWLPLASLSANFAEAGPGRVLVVDAASGNVSRTVDLPSAKNCVRALAVPGSQAVAVVCLGFFGDGAAQAYGSQLVWLAPGAPPLVLVQGSQLGPASLQAAAFVDERWALLVSAGHLAAKTPDTVWLLDRQSGALQQVAKADKAFAISGLYADPVRRQVWLGERGHSAGDLRVFALTGGGVTELAAVRANPGSLGAVDLGGY